MSKELMVKILGSFLLMLGVICSKSLDERLASLEGLSREARVEVMNGIKEELMQMNEEARGKGIEKLRAKLHGEHTVEEHIVEHEVDLHHEHHDWQQHHSNEESMENSVHHQEVHN